MKRTRFTVLFFLSISLSGCQNKEQQNIRNTFSFHIEDHKSKFKYNNLDTFQIDTLDQIERDERYHRMTEKEYYSIYQDTTLHYEGGYEQSISLDFFYSIQNRHSPFQEITVLWQHEGDYCDGIDYMIFDKQGRLIDKFLLAGGCGDGGYYDEKYGHFVNDSTYRLTIEENEDADDEMESFVHTIRERIYTITKTGKVKFSERLIRQDTIN